MKRYGQWVVLPRSPEVKVVPTEIKTGKHVVNETHQARFLSQVRWVTGYASINPP
jgi:hypothetical protein